jgi:hypothetical protein
MLRLGAARRRIQGHEIAVRVLTDAGVRRDGRDERGATRLHVAVPGRQLVTVQAMRSLGSTLGATPPEAERGSNRCGVAGCTTPEPK